MLPPPHTHTTPQHNTNHHNLILDSRLLLCYKNRELPASDLPRSSNCRYIVEGDVSHFLRQAVKPKHQFIKLMNEWGGRDSPWLAHNPSAKLMLTSATHGCALLKNPSVLGKRHWATTSTTIKMQRSRHISSSTVPGLQVHFTCFPCTTKVVIWGAKEAANFWMNTALQRSTNLDMAQDRDEWAMKRKLVFQIYAVQYSPITLVRHSRGECLGCTRLH